MSRLYRKIYPKISKIYKDIPYKMQSFRRLGPGQARGRALYFLVYLCIFGYIWIYFWVYVLVYFWYICRYIFGMCFCLFLSVWRMVAPKETTLNLKFVSMANIDKMITRLYKKGRAWAAAVPPPVGTLQVST